MQRALAVAVVSATQFLTVFDGVVVVIALPAIGRDLGLATVDAQWVVTAYTLPFAGLLLLGGRLGDLLGRRRVLRVGLVVFGAGLVGAGLAPSTATLLAARVVQGIGAAAAGPASFALISSAFAPEQRRAAFATASIAGSGAAVAGAAVGGVVVDALGWQWIFVLSAPVAIAAAALARVLPERRDRRAERSLDTVGAAMATAALALFVFAVTNVARAGAAAPSTLAALAGALVVGAVLLAYERRAAAPLLPVGLLRVRTLRRASAAMFGEDFAYNAALLLGLLWLQRTRGLTATAAGLHFLPFSLVTAAAAPVAARALRRWRWAHVAAGGLTLSATGLALLARAPAGGRYAVDVMPALLVLGAGIAVGFVALSEAAGSDVPEDDKGIAYGVFETVTHVSGTIAVATLATVASAASFGAGFAVAAGVAVAVAGGVVIGERRA